MLGDYLTEFAALHAEAEQQLQTVERQQNVKCTNSSSNSLPLTAAPQKVEALLKKLKRCLSSLEMELRVLPREERQQHEARLTDCRLQLEALQKRTLLLRRGFSNPRTQVCARRTQEQMEGGTRDISQSCRLASEAEAMGEAALSSLLVQRETLSRTLTRSQEAHKELDAADTVLTRMSRWWKGVL